MADRTISTTALEHVTRGTYHRASVDTGSQTWTISTELELDELSDVLAASGKDEMFSWIRYQFWLYSAASACRFEWMLVKQLSTEALPDMNDDATMEYLFKERKIFARGLMAQTAPTYGVRMIKGELYNVKLSDGEELRFVIRPMTAGLSDMAEKGLIEYRQIGN